MKNLIKSCKISAALLAIAMITSCDSNNYGAALKLSSLDETNYITYQSQVESDNFIDSKEIISDLLR